MSDASNANTASLFVGELVERPAEERLSILQQYKNAGWLVPADTASYPKLERDDPVVCEYSTSTGVPSTIFFGKVHNGQPHATVRSVIIILRERVPVRPGFLRGANMSQIWVFRHRDVRRPRSPKVG